MPIFSNISTHSTGTLYSNVVSSSDASTSNSKIQTANSSVIINKGNAVPVTNNAPSDEMTVLAPSTNSGAAARVSQVESSL